MSNKIGRELLRSLKKRYESEIQSNKTTMLIYLQNSVGIGEHPQHIDELDEMLTKITEANDKIENLLKEFPEEEFN
jgi:hypothetical protein